MPSGLPSQQIFQVFPGDFCHYDAECRSDPFFLTDDEIARRREMRPKRNRELLETSETPRNLKKSPKKKSPKSEYPSSQPSSNPTSEPTWVKELIFLWHSLCFYISYCVLLSNIVQKGHCLQMSRLDLLLMSPAEHLQMSPAEHLPMRYEADFSLQSNRGIDNNQFSCYAHHSSIMTSSPHLNNANVCLLFLQQPSRFPSDEPSLHPSDEPSRTPSDEPSRMVRKIVRCLLSISYSLLNVSLSLFWTLFIFIAIGWTFSAPVGRAVNISYQRSVHSAILIAGTKFGSNIHEKAFGMLDTTDYQ